MPDWRSSRFASMPVIRSFKFNSKSPKYTIHRFLSVSTAQSRKGWYILEVHSFPAEQEDPMRKTSTGSMSRRRFLGTAAGAGMAAAAGHSLPSSPGGAVLAAQGPQAVAPAGGPAQDLTLVNGRIRTMDPRSTVASTVTIRNGRFAIVGNGRPPSGTQVIDLRGRTVVP